MALALADSIAEIGWNLNDQAHRYVAWWRKGEYSVNGRCFDTGSTTRSALARFEKTADARASGDASENAAGNGSIMRLAPVPIRYASAFSTHLDELVTLCMDSSRPTHASPASIPPTGRRTVPVSSPVYKPERTAMRGEGKSPPTPSAGVFTAIFGGVRVMLQVCGQLRGELSQEERLPTTKTTLASRGFQEFPGHSPPGRVRPKPQGWFASYRSRCLGEAGCSFAGFEDQETRFAVVRRRPTEHSESSGDHRCEHSK